MAGAANARNVEVLNITNATVHYLVRVRRDAAAEVTPVDQGHPIAAESCLPGRTGSEYAGARDEQVILALLQNCDVSLKRYYVTHHSFVWLSSVECSGADSRMLHSARITIINSTAVHAKSSEQIIGHLGRIVGHNGFKARYMDY